MSKGIVYIMTTVVPGLIKIGRTEINQFNNRMNCLESNGYSNITGLKRAFAIEVDKYKEKELLLHMIFAKSRVGNTEFFAVDVNIAMQLLSSFDGTIIFPESETKSEIFDNATDNIISKLIPDGTYKFERKKQSYNEKVYATVVIKNGKWKLIKGSHLSKYEDAGVSQIAKVTRAQLSLDNECNLLDDFDLGSCSPSFAAVVVLNAACNGWEAWKNEDGKPVDIYRKIMNNEEE